MESWISPPLPSLPRPVTGPLALYDTARDGVYPTGGDPDPSRRTMYVCGITPYDATHLGHAATMIVFDLINRAWRDAGLQVTYVQNVTDIDDPLLERANRDGEDWLVLAMRETALFREDMEALRILPPAHYVGAVESIPPIAERVVELIDRGAAYRLEDGSGDVYFDLTAAPRFGYESHLDRATMRVLSAERGGDPDRPGKRNPLDFILWQPSRPGEPEYESPFGAGRPGWHIGCSVMSREAFGTRVDVHGGGSDLIFPHHECEQAQNSSLEGGTAVGMWVHTQPVAYQGEKMSKSLGNIVLARDLLKAADPRAIRLAVHRRYHHRHGCEWRDSDLYEGVALLTKVLLAARRPTGPDPRPFVAEARARLDDDLDVPGATRQLERLAEATLADGGPSTDTAAGLAEIATLLGVPLDRPPVQG
jgi:L-cysteine:1D-myo-inositol 2-amino-2-deoxy-alpha-D-glucopyranoside ligase